jgi:DNA-binding ferritin-like protein
MKNPQPFTFKDTNTMSLTKTVKKEEAPLTKTNSVDTMVANLVTELMNAATSFHKLHLKVTGVGSHAAHLALKELYDALPDHADDVAEGYQGATEVLLKYKEPSTRILETVEDAIWYIKDLKEMVTKLQDVLPYSEIVNDLDNVKSTLNGVKYKLKFLS